MPTQSSSAPQRLQLHLTVSIDDETVRMLASRIADALTVRAAAPTSPPTVSATTRPQEPLLWTIRDVAKALQVCDKTVWNLRHTGQMPQPIMFGRTPRWSAKAIRAWIAAREQNTRHQL